jgi:transcriptional regulator with XRE-family HTH domain
MTTRTKKLATLLAGAVALCSGAYALGSEAGDGGAVAAGTRGSGGTAVNGTNVSQSGRPARVLRRRGGFGLSTLADRLGVSETALRDALRAIRDAKTPAQRRTELVQALASALGRPAADVQAALDRVKPARADRRDEVAAAIGNELGVDAAKVQAAFDQLRQHFRERDRDRNGPGRRGRRGDRRDALVNAIASATGADAATVRAALQKVRQDLGPRRGDRRDRRDDVRRRLADALGVTAAQLDAAFDKVRTDQRNAFATDLAQRLKIDVAKVQGALQDLPRRGGRRHG